MKKYLILILSFCFFSVSKAQTADSVTNKFNKIPFTPFSVFAKFTGGDFEEYVEKNIRYPVDQIQNINGEIVIAFSVDSEGNVVNVRLLKNLSPAVDREMIRVFNSSPKWIPAKLRGNNVKVNIGMRLMIITDSVAKTIKATKTKPSSVVQTENAIYTAVSGPPQFPGGLDSLHQYLSKNIVYPAELLKEHVSGMVYLSFVIEKDGSLTDIKAVRSPSDGLTKEAIRVMQSAKYINGTQNGHPVRVAYIMGINFDPNNPNKH